ncbi:MAG TPA: hypothetical protein VD930_09975 [Gemmatimonadales bacterium]|nr:hypothetical protein [Gemmatimonadales bacterium]
MSRKGRSQRKSRGLPVQPGFPPAAADPPRRPVTALSRELADFLVELSIVLHKRSMYPAGHPHLQDSADRFVRRMNLLLQNRESVTLGVARHRLVIDGVTTDANNALLRDLALRLHRHRIATVHLSRGATLEQTEGLLVALSADPQRGDGPVGKRLDRLGPWPHIRLRPMGYDRFELQGPGTDTDATNALNARDSWVELAQLALAGEEAGNGSIDPVVLADAIGRKSGEVAYERVVLGYLARVADEISQRRTGTSDQLAQRISKLLGALNPETLQRLLAASTDRAARRQFLLNASQILAADAVMEVVEAAAQASNQTISHNLLRLLHKLAHHAENGAASVRAEADGALRTNVTRLIDDWDLEDPNPSEYTAILEGMVQRPSGDFSLVHLQAGYDPETILKTALELDCVGPPVYAAVEQLLSRRELMRIVDLLESIPASSAADALWRYVATPERLNRELAAVPVDYEALSILVERIGTQAADSLLDRLASASDRSTRAAVLKQLQALGPAVAPVAVARLAGAPWFVQRNILVLLGKVGSWPPGFSPVEYAAHSDSRVRREAIKLMLESPSHRSDGMILGLTDTDETIVGLALAAGVDGCAPEALAMVRRIAADPKHPSESRVLAVRLLARTRTADSFRVLHDLVMHRRRWLGRRVAPKSPELLAALSALASRWADDPVAAEVLMRASQHSDPDIRAAATKADL